MSSLQDKVAILTGASNGIGLATVKHFLSQGAKVYGVDIKAPTDEDLVKVLDDSSSNYAFLQADLTQASVPEELVTACTRRFGERIDILGNIAGIMDGFGSADKVSDETLGRVIDVNLKAPIRLMGAVLPVMKAQKRGAIVNVSSTAALTASVAGIAYTAAKQGLVGATKNVAWRYREDGIRANALAPGGVETGIANALPEFDMDSYMSCKKMHDVFQPGGQFIMKPIEVAKMIAFLASDAASMVNGVLLPVDCGAAAVVQ